MKKLSIFLICSVAIALAFVSPITSFADRQRPNWMVGDPQYTEGAMVESPEGCTNQDIKIEGLPYHIYVSSMPDYKATIDGTATLHHDACVYHAKHYRYTRYTRMYYADPTLPSFGTYADSGIAVSYGDDTDFRRVDGLETEDGQFLGGESDAFIQHSHNSWAFAYYENLLDHLEWLVNGTLVLDNNPDYQYKDMHGGTPEAYGVAVSHNKRWVTFGVRNFGIILLDLHTFRASRISDRYDIQGWTWPIPILVTSVSDDGRYVVVGGVGYRTEVIITSGCGSPALADGYGYHTQLLGAHTCNYRDLTSMTNAHSDSISSNAIRALVKLSVSTSGDMFTYWDNYKWNTIYAPNYLMPGQMYYVAVGDSYASGDGDITLDGVDHYLPGTNIYGDYINNIPRETCHISERSYAMRMARAMNLMRGVDMQSIACSGATLPDILSINKESTGYVNSHYLGQPTQLLAQTGGRLLGITNASKLQADARSSYIPGRVQQIELIKKAQPKYATLMIGGNDIDFPGFMMACAKNSLPPADETCDYAEGEGLAGEAKKVHDLYPKLVSFYHAIKIASPHTVYYVVGYPQFMDDQNPSCQQMLNLYTLPERRAIRNLIAYANAIIHNAALDAGFKYVDIGDALVGKQLCGGGTGMTGITDVLATTIYTEYMKSLTMSDSKLAQVLNVMPAGGLHEVALRIYLAERASQLVSGYFYSPATALADISQELSHPNAVGHQAMYDAIAEGLGADLLDSMVCDGRVACPNGSQYGQPDISTYLPGLAIRDDTVYVSGGTHITMGHRTAAGVDTLGSLTKGSNEQFIRIGLNVIDGQIDSQKPVTVEIHSVPQALGAMRLDGDGYELRTTLPTDIKVGQHVLHIKGSLLDGSSFDLDSPVFVEGPAGDIDDDGIADHVDTCAFGKPSGIDLDHDGIDDACDVAVVAQTADRSNGAVSSLGQPQDEKMVFASSNTPLLMPSDSNVAATHLSGVAVDADSDGSHSMVSNGVWWLAMGGVTTFLALLLGLHYIFARRK